MAAKNFANQGKPNEISKDLIVLVILNSSRQSILLKNASGSNNIDNFQYWFPFFDFDSKEPTGNFIERTINVKFKNYFSLFISFVSRILKKNFVKI